MLTALIVFSILTTAAYYLLARAEITRRLWSHYPKKVDELARCPACSGTWLGLALAGLWPIALEPHFPVPLPLWLGLVLGAACGMLFVPLGTQLLVGALRATHIDEEPTDELQEHHAIVNNEEEG